MAGEASKPHSALDEAMPLAREDVERGEQGTRGLYARELIVLVERLAIAEKSADVAESVANDWRRKLEDMEIRLRAYEAVDSDALAKVRGQGLVRQAEERAEHLQEQLAAVERILAKSPEKSSDETVRALREVLGD